MKTITIPVSFAASDNASVMELTHSAEPGTDAEIISLVRDDPPDEAALNMLVERYWGPLFARCKMLTSNREKALDLAQSAWCRLLRNRRALRPDGNVLAYLTTIATNLFRDSYRAARRAGPMADYQLESLNAPCPHEDDEASPLAEFVADLKTLLPEEQTLMAIDIDGALAHLTPQMRDVLVSRFIDGESCAEIGVRYGRTEQTISGWIREALRQMKTHLEEPGGNTDYAAAEMQAG